MEDVAGIERHTVFHEPYVLIFPKDYKGDTDLHTGTKEDLPFLRISLRSAMGLRIERQLNRLKVKFPDVAEFDRAPAQAMAVAQGMGWGVTTPLCLLEKPDVIPNLHILPIKRGAFSRKFDLLAREGALGDIPRELANHARDILRQDCVPILYDQVPWLETLFRWNDEEL